MQWFLFLFLRSVIGNNPWSGMKQRFQSCCSASVFAKSMHYCPTQGSSSRWQNKANYISAFSDCQDGIVTLCILLFYSNVSVGNTSFCKQCSVRRFLLAMLFCISIFVNLVEKKGTRISQKWWNLERTCVASAWTSRSTKQRVQSWQWDVTTNGSINDTLDLSGGYPFRLNLLHRKFWEPSLKGGSHFIFMIFGPFSARDFFGMNYDVLILRLAIFHLGDIPIEAT